MRTEAGAAYGFLTHLMCDVHNRLRHRLRTCETCACSNPGLPPHQPRVKCQRSKTKFLELTTPPPVAQAQYEHLLVRATELERERERIKAVSAFFPSNYHTCGFPTLLITATGTNIDTETDTRTDAESDSVLDSDTIRIRIRFGFGYRFGYRFGFGYGCGYCVCTEC